MKANKTRNELNVSDSKIYRLKTVEQAKNGGKSSLIWSRKRLRSITTAPWLGFSSWKHIFSPKTAEMYSLGVMNIFETAPSPIYRKEGRCLQPRGFLRKISECTPITKCRNLPFGGRATRDSRVRLPRKEYARSHHQRLFEENIGKTGKDMVYEL